MYVIFLWMLVAHATGAYGELGNGVERGEELEDKKRWISEGGVKRGQ